MPKKKPGMTPEEQGKKFIEEAERLIEAGELNPTEADDAFERAVSKIAPAKPISKRE